MHRTYGILNRLKSQCEPHFTHNFSLPNNIILINNFYAINDNDGEMNKIMKYLLAWLNSPFVNEIRKKYLDGCGPNSFLLIRWFLVIFFVRFTLSNSFDIIHFSSILFFAMCLSACVRVWAVIGSYRKCSFNSSRFLFLSYFLLCSHHLKTLFFISTWCTNGLLTIDLVLFDLHKQN